MLSPFQRNDANRRAEEHAVNHMANALLRLDRVKNATPAPAATTTTQPAQMAVSAPR